jgi:hypothetical protein
MTFAVLKILVDPKRPHFEKSQVRKTLVSAFKISQKLSERKLTTELYALKTKFPAQKSAANPHHNLDYN